MPTIQQQTETHSPSPLTALNITTQDVWKAIFPDSPPTSTIKDITSMLTTEQTETHSPSPLTALNITTDDMWNTIFSDSPPNQHKPFSTPPYPQSNGRYHYTGHVGRTSPRYPSNQHSSPSYVYPLPPTTNTGRTRCHLLSLQCLLKVLP